MDPFSYLSVLLSIIIGLAMTQVLQGYRALLLARSRVRLFWPSLIWSALILVLATQNWWSSFGLAEHDSWTFPVFATILLQTVLLYMMAGLVLPDMPPGEPVTLRSVQEMLEMQPCARWLNVAMAGRRTLRQERLSVAGSGRWFASIGDERDGGIGAREVRFHAAHADRAATQAPALAPHNINP